MVDGPQRRVSMADVAAEAGVSRQCLRKQEESPLGWWVLRVNGGAA